MSGAEIKFKISGDTHRIFFSPRKSLNGEKESRFFESFERKQQKIF